MPAPQCPATQTLHQIDVSSAGTYEVYAQRRRRLAQGRLVVQAYAGEVCSATMQFADRLRPMTVRPRIALLLLLISASRSAGTAQSSQTHGCARRKGWRAPSVPPAGDAGIRTGDAAAQGSAEGLAAYHSHRR